MAINLIKVKARTGEVNYLGVSHIVMVEVLKPSGCRILLTGGKLIDVDEDGKVIEERMNRRPPDGQ